MSPACEHCYAETWAKRTGHELWGKRAPRRLFGEAHWREPLKWNRDAEALGERRRVFCASMADVFEDRRELDAERARLWDLIEATPALDWLLLTKRPENVRSRVRWDKWPANVWLGATVENQDWAKKRVPELIAVPAVVHFVSCEPLLGALDLEPWLGSGGVCSTASAAIDWVIAGGESGGRARSMDPGWARSLRDQCARRGVPFHFKQWGEWRPELDAHERGARLVAIGGETLARAGKRTAGRELDGRTWDGLPTTSVSSRSSQTRRRA